jgi:hypothetical protein
LNASNNAPTAASLISSKTFRVDSDLAPHTAEVLSAEARGALRAGNTAFRFAVDPSFLPTIGWLDRFRTILEPIVHEKKPVEIVYSPSHIESMRRAGIHLIADMVVSVP